MKIYIFKEGGKLLKKPKINSDFLFYMYQSYGIPSDMLIDYINGLSLKRRNELVLYSWIKYESNSK